MNLRKIDALVAEKVMEWTDCDEYFGCPPEQPDDGFHIASLPHFCTDLSNAWEVVNRLTGQEWSFKLEYSEIYGWIATFAPRAQHWKSCQCMAYVGQGETAPLAICLAALRAMGTDVEVSPLAAEN